MAKKVPFSQRRRCLIRPASLVTGSASATASFTYSSLRGGGRWSGQAGCEQQEWVGGRGALGESAVQQRAGNPAHCVLHLPVRRAAGRARARGAGHSQVLAVLARHNLQAEHAILCQVHVGLKRAQGLLGVETVEVAAEGLALRGRGGEARAGRQVSWAAERQQGAASARPQQAG